MIQPTLIDVPGAGELSSAVLSECGTYRYSLERVWDIDLPRALWLMLNPSTATADVDDPTISRVRNFSKREGCGGLIVVNLFALRATDPKELAIHPDPFGPDNNLYLARALSSEPSVVIAAWGAHRFAATQAAAVSLSVATQLGHQGLRLKCLGTTKDGYPKHPLYLAKNTPLITYQPKKG